MFYIPIKDKSSKTHNQANFCWTALVCHKYYEYRYGTLK